MFENQITKVIENLFLFRNKVMKFEKKSKVSNEEL